MAGAELAPDTRVTKKQAVAVRELVHDLQPPSAVLSRPAARGAAGAVVADLDAQAGGALLPPFPLSPIPDPRADR